MKLYESNVEVQHNGKKVIVDVYEAGRGGTESPSQYYILANGRWVTPYEQDKRGWILPFLNWLFKKTYGPHLRDLVYGANALLSVIPKDKNYGGMYHQPVVLGLEHGVTFTPYKLPEFKCHKCCANIYSKCICEREDY